MAAFFASLPLPPLSCLVFAGFLASAGFSASTDFSDGLLSALASTFASALASTASTGLASSFLASAGFPSAFGAALVAFSLAASASALARASAFAAASASALAFSSAAFSASAFWFSAATFALAYAANSSEEGMVTARLRRRVSTFTPSTVLTSVFLRRMLMVPLLLPFFFCR